MNTQHQYEQTQSERNYELEDDDIINPQNHFDIPNNQLKTGRFAPSPERTSTNIEQFKMKNIQFTQLIEQLKAPPTSYLTHNQNQMPAYYQQPNIQQPSGISQNKLNQDNSLLALVQTKPLGSSGGTNQMDSSPIENDFFFKESNFYTNPSLTQQNMDYKLSNEVNNSRIVGKQKIDNIMAQDLNNEYGKENFDQNLSKQIKHYKSFADESQIQQVQKCQQQIHFYNRQRTQQETQKKQIMEHFDDIPIKELNKVEGYKNDKVQENDEAEEEGESLLSIFDRIDHPKWKTRMRAYKHINELFYEEHAKELQQQKGNSQRVESQEDEGNAFTLYAPILQKIISDNNLVAQYEGLNCLLAYMKFASDIKAVTFQVHRILLDKVQLIKPNFKEITINILMHIVRKDKSQCVLMELLKRFKNKNSKTVLFAMEVILLALKKQFLVEDVNMKTIFTSTSYNLSHSNKELRDTATELLKEIYKLCIDDVSNFVNNLQSLRPVQLKDIKDMLLEIQKSPTAQILLFQQQIEASTNGEGFGKIKKKQTEEIKNEEEQQESNQTENDLFLLLPDNFQEIPYLSQINVKKKVMEQFNIELEKMITKKQQVIQKDYTTIYNVVVHMLEDSNALVFMEAIKTVEYLSILLGKNLKSQKLRQFIQLLADKYKETKTAVITAINKTFSVIIQRQNLPLIQVIDYLVVTIAYNHKNPRVKQLILEKVDSILREETLSEDELTNIFKIVKEKILNFIQKDTIANVRDAAVQLLTSFKQFLPNSQMVNDTINQLPKYRVTEINKKATEQKEQKNQDESKQQKVEIQTPKESQKTSRERKEDDFSYKGRTVSGQYQIHLAEIILSLKKMKQGNYPDIATLQEKWELEIEKLGEKGIQESKPIIVSCVSWLLSGFINKEFENQEILNQILILIKKVYCIERSVDYNEQGQSSELMESISIALISCQWCQNKKQIDALLNVILSAAGNTQKFIDTLKSTLSQYKTCSFLPILEFTFKWLANKSEYLIGKGIGQVQFEELRSIGLQFISQDQDENTNNRIIQIMMEYKNLIQLTQENDHFEQSAIQQEEEQEHDIDEEEKGEVNNLLGSIPQSLLKTEDLTQKQQSRGQQIAGMIDQNFEQGLMMIKEFANSSDSQDFVEKEIVFNKLISIVTNHCKNPQQQYQQAYSLKALLWYKEQVLGLEDCFKLASSVMSAFAKTSLEERDNSVELYMLNHWVKDLSLRDLIDRITMISVNQNEQLFLILFNWLMTHSLNATNQEWMIEDFRKSALLLAKNIKSQEVRSFFQQCVEKFGDKKVRDFMEIQLMHSPQEYNAFIDWFNTQYKSINTNQSAQQNSSRLVLPQIKIDEIQKEQTVKMNKALDKDSELQNVLKSNNNESVCSSARAGTQGMNSYQVMRERRKNSNQRKQEDSESNQKYEDIISRLEAQLHQKKQDESIPNSRQKSVQNNYHSHISNRYETMQTDDDLNEQDSINLPQQSNDNNLQNAQDALMTSQIKEDKWKQELFKLEQERQKIEKERETLMQEKNKETDEWKSKYEHMKDQHQEIIGNLKEANKCYLMQVNENEDLRKQLKIMQEQHLMMMRKFEEIENKINMREDTPKVQIQSSITINKPIQEISKQQNSVKVISEEKISQIEQVFKNQQVQKYQNDGEFCLRQIQELLLDNDKTKGQEIGESLFFYYTKIKTMTEKLIMVQGLNKSLDNEDVLYALSNETYKEVLLFSLKVFSKEKAIIENQSLRMSHQSIRGQVEQNEITIEVQKVVSRLLNSKEFTTSLVTLFQILKEAMPTDISQELNEEQKQLLRVIMRCISRITKALHSENPDLIRAFDVFLEMNKIFIRNPPEQLREDLPSLQDLDYVYRGMKDATDKLMELQPDKVMTFLRFVNDKQPNAFTKYMKQMLQVHNQQFDEDDENFNNIMEQQQYKPRKSSEQECIVCTDQALIFAIGECGHSHICWKCSLKQRFKLGKKECPYCKNVNYKLFLTKNKNLTLTEAPNALYDNDTDLYFEDQQIKNEVLKGLGNYCKICENTEYRKKFATQKQLADHYKRQHNCYLCEQCLEHKPVLMIEQKVYEYDQLNFHYRKNHPTCFFCPHQTFYDQDQLNKHYINLHYFCDICKKQGRKRIQNDQNKRINLPDYEVYRDTEELRNHWKKNHYMCDRPECLDLVFEDRVQMAQHYFIKHGERIPVQLGFASDDEEEQVQYGEEKKQEQIVLTKETYRDQFPTLHSTNKTQNSQSQGIFERDRWPTLPQNKANQAKSNQNTQSKGKIQQKNQQQKAVKDKQSRVLANQQRKEERKQLQQIERQIDNTDYDLEYRENEYSQNIPIEEQKVKKQDTKKKIKKTIVVSQQPKYEEEVKYSNQRQEDFPNLIETNTQIINNKDTGWKQTGVLPKKNQTQVKFDHNALQTQQLHKEHFPGLPREEKKNKTNINTQKQEVTKKTKQKNKNKGRQVTDMNEFDPKIDYNKNMKTFFNK